MKIENIKDALGIGTIVDENNCMFMESTKKWYDRLKYNEDLLIYFNSIQGGNYIKAMNHKHVYSFLSRGSEMIFYALYEVLDKTTVKEAVKKKLFPVNEYEKNVHKIDRNSNGPFYLIKQIKTPGNLEKRLVTQSLKNRATIIGYEKFSQYDVNSIEKIKLATEFNSYEDVCLNYNELQMVIKDGVWQERLSRYGGVYLIHDKYTGKNYIGSAYNESGGFLGRWSDYANNPTGGKKDTGNKMLVELLEKKCMAMIQF